MTTKVPLETLPVDLIYDDGDPMDSPWHRSQLNLLIEETQERFRGRTDYYTGGDMFVYYSSKQAEAIKAEEAAERAWADAGRVGEPPKKTEFRGPDYFCVLDVDGRRRREGWVVWEEEGRYPDIIVEILSRSTRKNDLGPKKKLYERTFRTREYICFDHVRDELVAWRLVDDEYQPIRPDVTGRIWSQVLGAFVGRWKGVYQGQDAAWLRLFDEAGNLIPIGLEIAESERERADSERERAESERERAEAALAELERLRKLLGRE